MLKPATRLAFAFLSLTGGAAADDFRLYVNARFDVSAWVPKSWRSPPPPENADGLVFVSPDRHGEVTVSGMLNSDGDAKVDPSRIISLGAQATYQGSGAGWAVASGEKDGKLFTGNRSWAARARSTATSGSRTRLRKRPPTTRLSAASRRRFMGGAEFIRS